MLQLLTTLSVSRTGTPMIDELLALYLRHLKFDFEDLVWRANSAAIAHASHLIAIWESLESSQQIRLLLSPMFYQRMTACQGSHLASHFQTLVDWIGTLQHSPDMQDDQLVNRVGGTILIDFGSEDCQRYDARSPVFHGDFIALTQHERAECCRKIQCALDEIDHTAPSMGRLIRNYTRLIYLRKHANPTLASEQVDSEIGAIRLRNVHLPQYTHYQLVDDLIHESTHNFLSTYEYLCFPFLLQGRSVCQTIRPVSPWSGRPILATAYLHAVFVYFVMLNFVTKQWSWHQDQLTDDQKSNLIQRRNRYSSGFLFPQSLSDQVSRLVDVDPRVSHAIDVMQASVKSRYS